MSKAIIKKEDNIQYCEDTIKMVVQANLAYIITAKRLSQIAEERLYMPKWDSFDEFAMDCMKESKGKINTLMNIYRKFVIQGEMKEEKVSKVGWTVLGKALPLIHSKEDARHWLQSAEDQMPSDYNRMIKEAKTGKDMTACEHKDTYKLEVCNDCKDKWEVFDVASITELDIYHATEKAGLEITIGEAQTIFKALVTKAYETEESIPSED